MSILSFSDNIMALRILRLLTMPYQKTAAFKNGCIDENGKLLIHFNDMNQDQKNSYTLLHRMVFNLRRLLLRVPVIGKSILLNYAAALMLIKEHTGISDNQLKEILIESVNGNNELITTINESFILLNEQNSLINDDVVVGPSVNTTSVGNVDVPTKQKKKKKKNKDDDESDKENDLLLLSRKEKMAKSMNIENTTVQERYDWETRVSDIMSFLSPITHNKNYDDALKVLTKTVFQKKQDNGLLKHGIYYYASEIAKTYVNVDGRKLAELFFKWYKKEFPKDDYKLRESIDKSAAIDVWIKDFYDSDAPQFKGKSKEERRKMAVAAFLSNKMKKEENETFVDNLLQEATDIDKDIKELQKKIKIILTTSDYAESILDSINDNDETKVDSLLKHDVPDATTRKSMVRILFNK